MSQRILFYLLTVILFGCEMPAKNDQEEFNIQFEKFTLDNGLDVVFHIDRSDPVVAIALTAHVGSAREKKGRTGFAHLFEHLLFLESENLGKGGLDKMSARIGGSGANGSTNRDRTNYFQTVPKDALEKMIWAEADKLGWFINTVTEPVLAKEKQVVKNEKRQSIDNRPYGHTNLVIDKHLYPEDHPYNWQVIGSLEDLQNATLEDVKEFFNIWYVPNNTTLVISGDFDQDQARKWVKKYFDEIEKGEEIVALPKRAGRVDQTIRLYFEDNFARLPELTLAWPTVELYHPDSYALTILTQYLSQGKAAPLYQILVEEKQLSSNVRMFNRASELAGQTHLAVRAYAEKDLDEVLGAIEEAFSKFDSEGIPEKDLDRIKAREEAQFYNGLSSVLGKGFQLAQYNIFAKDPGFINQDIQNLLKVTSEDVLRVFNKYIRDKNFIATSFVPKGSPDQALESSEKADIIEETIQIGAEATFDPAISGNYERTPSSFDRSIEPPYGATLETTVPKVWQNQLSNGFQVYGIENNEVPLVQFNLVIDGGLLLDNMDKVGVSNLLANMMTKGTKYKTPVELEAAIETLGATINVSAQQENITLSVTTLSKNYEETLDLIEEILLEPRWDENEFELEVQRVRSQIKQQEANPNSIAQNIFNQLIYGQDNIRSKNVLGSIETVNSISMDDLKGYYTNYFSPSTARMHIVGAKTESAIMNSLRNIEIKWENKEVTFPEYPDPSPPDESKIYFYDVPNAKQSVLRIGYPAFAATNKDYYDAIIANYKLGGGGFASQLTQELREGKGYTYGIRSSFLESKTIAPFTISSSVRSNVTLESVQLIKHIIENYGLNFSKEDLETTKSFFIKSNARVFETTRAKLQMLQNISDYGWDSEYVKQRESVVKGMTVIRIKELAQQYLDAEKMIWLIVGDGQTQFDRIKKLGFGTPILIDKTTKVE